MTEQESFDAWWSGHRVKQVLNPAGFARMVWHAAVQSQGHMARAIHQAEGGTEATPGAPATPLMQRMAAKMHADAEADRAHKAALIAEGVCPECEGDGEQGGQFCGGYWTCEACQGTGEFKPQGGA